MSNIKGAFMILILLASTSLTAGENSRGRGNRDFDLIVAGTKAEPRILACQAPEFSFHLPQMAGNFRLGIANGTNSLWGSDLKKVSVKKEKASVKDPGAKEEKGKFIYTLQDPLLGNGRVTVKVTGISDSNGIVLEVEAENIPDETRLMWSFGGCYGKVLEDPTDSKLEPAYCKYNVFSVEGTAFSVYYGESMRLRIIHGVTPLDSDIRLSDAHQQQTPLAFYESGKKTDAPALAASTPLKNGEKLYFCFYTQNKKADYNYYMLPDLFNRTFWY